MNSNRFFQVFTVTIGVIVLIVVGTFFALNVRRAFEPLTSDAVQVKSATPSAQVVLNTPIVATSTPQQIFVASSTTATILFAGDIMLDRNVKARSLAAKSRSYPFARLPADWFNSADYAVANLEGPITPVHRAPEKSIDFQFDPDVISALQATGIDAFSQANNHGLDQGSAGYQDSVAALRSAGFLAFGHQVQDSDISYATTTINGIRVAFMGWNTTDNPMDRVQAKIAIEHANAEADLIIAYLHWGLEYQDLPSRDQTDTAHWLIDQGLDAVIGGHPHWVQGLGSYKGKPIVWSLGNFIFDQDFSKETKQGMAVELTIDKEGIVQIIPIPIQIDRSQPRVVTELERQTRLDALSRISDESLQEMIRAGKVIIK